MRKIRVFVAKRNDPVELVVHWNDFDGHGVRTEGPRNLGFYSQALILELLAAHEIKLDTMA